MNESIPIAHSPRGRFAGLLQILGFNYPMFFAAGALVLTGIIILLYIPLPGFARLSAITLITLTTWWSLATLAVSHYVYDRFLFYEFHWLRPHLRPGALRRWTNIHAGFDQTTLPLRAAFPFTRGTPVDFFDPAITTESSIRRARRRSPMLPRTIAAQYDHIPLPNESSDALLLLFAAHELRTPAQRTALFREAARILTKGGAVIIAEHLRNPLNFAAFGPGVFHFHAHRQWLAAGMSVGLSLQAEFPLTPFATAFIWRKPK